MFEADPGAPLQRALVCALVLTALLGGRACAADRQTAEGFWSRVTLVVPVYTHHFPDQGAFDDRNWGAFVDVALDGRWSVVGGDYVNSFHRNTAFAGVSFSPVSVDLGKIRLRPGLLAGIDPQRGLPRAQSGRAAAGRLRAASHRPGLRGRGRPHPGPCGPGADSVPRRDEPTWRRTGEPGGDLPVRALTRPTRPPSPAG